jgi:hypothetical protein
MRICVVGGGFTGMIAAIALKRHCPDHTVIQIESATEPKNYGYGESGPHNLVDSMVWALRVPPALKQQWISDWLKETKSIIKYNLKWKDYTGPNDAGFYGVLNEMPSYEVIFNPSHTTQRLDSKFLWPNHQAYMLYDIWYELYLNGRRTLADYQQDIDPFYWFCEGHKISAVDGKVIDGLTSMHINSYEVCEWLKKRYSKILDEVIIDTVKGIDRGETGAVSQLHLESGRTVAADFYIDCTGFKRVFPKMLGLEYYHSSTEIVHNAAVVVANGYTENIAQEMRPYTVGHAMEAGWCFDIPLMDRKSYGYSFNTADATPDQILQEIDNVSDPKTRVIDPIVVKWEPGGYADSWQHNFAMVGLSSNFVDPIDANTIAAQFKQLREIVSWLQDVDNVDQHRNKYNYETRAHIDGMAERVQFHHGLAPRNTSEYWRRNKEVAERLNLKQQILEVMRHPDRCYHAALMGTQIPFLNHSYLAEVLYYDIDMSKRCRQSPESVLQLADDYFRHSRQLNQLRAEVSMPLKDWYSTIGINIANYIKFRS